jgi:uncharacterized iron-regulated membrane protein
MKINLLVKQLRQFRYVHRFIGIGIAFFLLITGVSGILLGWKKDVEMLQPPTMRGASGDMRNWRSFHEISLAAERGMDSIGQVNNTIDRYDVRPDKGIIKVLFAKGYWEVQVDGATARVLSVEQRHSDWIEHVHDGSILSDLFKLIYTNILGFGLLMLAITGSWLWIGPKIIRKAKAK